MNVLWYLMCSREYQIDIYDTHTKGVWNDSVDYLVNHTQSGHWHQTRKRNLIAQIKALCTQLLGTSFITKMPHKPNMSHYYKDKTQNHLIQ